jgi:hypothetical protein
MSRRRVPYRRVGGRRAVTGWTSGSRLDIWFGCCCVPADRLPASSNSAHDGFRIIARKTGAQVRLYSRPGNDLTRRFLVEDEKPGVCGGDARGGGRLELEHGRASAISPSLVPLLQAR